MYKRMIFILMLLLGTSTHLCQSGMAETINGKIITGYRVLTIDPDAETNNFTVYRGDYIKFSFLEKFASLPFSMPGMGYSNTLLPAHKASPFFKMKVTGSYDFTLGHTKGTITVIDLVRPNYTELTADEAAVLLKNIKPFILDVRTPAEYEQIHIAGTTLIPIQQLQSRIAELESKKHEDVFVYCATGNRSTVAARILADRGFKRIYNLRHGVYDYARKGHPYQIGK